MVTNQSRSPRVSTGFTVTFLSAGLKHLRHQRHSEPLDALFVLSLRSRDACNRIAKFIDIARIDRHAVRPHRKVIGGQAGLQLPGRYFHMFVINCLSTLQQKLGTPAGNVTTRAASLFYEVWGIAVSAYRKIIFHLARLPVAHFECPQLTEWHLPVFRKLTWIRKILDR